MHNRPEIVIEPPKGISLFDLFELRHYRALILSMSARQIKTRFNDLYLGIFWSVARPALMTLIFVYLKRASEAQMGVEVPYPAYLFSGLVYWFYFSGAVSETAGALARDAGLIQKVYFPRLISPVTPMLSRSVDLAIGAVIIAGMMVYYGMLPSWHLVLLPLVVVQTAAMILGIGLIFSALTLVSRDWDQFLGLILYVGLFVSPVIYAPQMIPEGARAIYAFNPMVGTLLGLRSCLFDSMPFPWSEWLYSLGFSLIVFSIGLWLFRRVEHRIIDKL